jgi:hydrogenase nickel incorporation protein HypA/HybF
LDYVKESNRIVNVLFDMKEWGCRVLHEIGVVMEVVKTVENFAKLNDVTKIQTLVLQIGELSSTIPKYVEACYPAAIEGTILEGAELKVEVLPGNGLCKKCGKVFNVLENHSACPYCQSKQMEVLSGREFFIKEIVAC